jgi:hypothetical protein
MIVFFGVQRLLNLIKDDNVGEETEKCFVDTVLFNSRTTLANISHTVLVDLIISNLEGLSKKVQSGLLSVLGVMK